jgi:hypothetical protein
MYFSIIKSVVLIESKIFLIIIKFNKEIIPKNKNNEVNIIV